MSCVTEFLKSTVAMMKMCNQRTINGYHGLHDFVLKNGRHWTPKILPAGMKVGTPRACFVNAGNLALKNPELIYVEGYATGVIPVNHAWCVTPDGIVVDPTWQYPNCSPGDVFFGVAVKVEYLRMTVKRNKQFGLLDQWECGFPWLTDDPALWRHPIMDRLREEAA
jgi:hypothetical protein